MAVNQRLEHILAANNEGETDIRGTYILQEGKLIPSKFNFDDDFLVQTQYCNYIIHPTGDSTILPRYEAAFDESTNSRTLLDLQSEESVISERMAKNLDRILASALKINGSHPTVSQITEYLEANRGYFLTTTGFGPSTYDHLSHLLGTFGVKIPIRDSLSGLVHLKK